MVIFKLLKKCYRISDLAFPFYQWRKWISNTVINFPKMTEFLNGVARIWTTIWLTWQIHLITLHLSLGRVWSRGKRHRKFREEYPSLNSGARLQSGEGSWQQQQQQNYTPKQQKWTPQVAFVCLWMCICSSNNQRKWGYHFESRGKQER